MYYCGYDDIELLYLIKNSNEWAINVMIEKYQPMIMNVINRLHIAYRYYDDMLQEGRIVLLKAIESFDERYAKTFYRYFELILIRYLIKKRKSWQSDIVCEEIYEIVSTEANGLEECLVEYGRSAVYSCLKTEIEKLVYERYFCENESIAFIASDTGYSRKQIYNVINRIKLKVKGIDLINH